MHPSATVSSVVARLAHSRARAPSASDLVAALRQAVGPIELPPPQEVVAARPNHTLVARGSTWRLMTSVFPPGTSTALHVHRTPVAWRVLSGHALESVLGQHDRTWAPGEVGETSPGVLHQISNPGEVPLVLLALHAELPEPAPVTAPEPEGAPGFGRIAILGGGLSAAALTYHLAIRVRHPLQVTIIERGAWLGRGIAYGVSSPVFRLNVPASRMSLDPQLPDDFARWSGVTATPDVFLARTRYGAYVEDRLGAALASSPLRVTLLRADALAVDAGGVYTNRGRIDADRVVLATGLVPRQAPGWLAVDPRIVDAWNEPALHFLPPDGRLLILGSGLSAIDVLGVLEAAGFRGRVVMLSRHGLLPRPHLARLSAPPALDAARAAEAPRDLRGLVRWARAVVREQMQQGHPWQLAFDSLRPHVPRLWAGLPPADRARFVRTVRPYWEVLRHRAPIDALAVIEEWRAKGRLQLQAGRVVGCHPRVEGLEVDLMRHGVTQADRFDGIVRCIGPAVEDSHGQSPLLEALIASGAVRRDPAQLGIVTDGEGRLIGADGTPSSRFFAMGALRRASSWETTAVPEISRQAMALATLLLG